MIGVLLVARGGVLGAMDTMYQRGKIQEESMVYEHKKHDMSISRRCGRYGTPANPSYGDDA